MKKPFQPRNLLILGLAFLWLRNAPLALFLPIWVHGDEIGHLDYLMKVGRGRLPLPGEYIEPAVFRLHKGHYDGRYISPDKDMVFVMPQDLGLAAYSYEAPQPPLPYLLLAAFRFPMKAAGMPLLAQVRALRLVSLLAMSAGLLLIFAVLKRRKDLGLFWHAPLLFIPLLAQDMFVSLNTDSFAFLFGCGVVWTIFRLFERPASAGRWAALGAAVVLAMWTKATCAFFFALWPIVAVVLFLRVKKAKMDSGCADDGRALRKAGDGAGESGAPPMEEGWEEGEKSELARTSKERRRIVVYAAAFFTAALALSAPWYVANSARNSYVFGFQFNETNDLSYKRFNPPPLRSKEILEFGNAFGHSLLRGELLWKGKYLEGLPQPWDNILTQAVVWIVFALGLLAVFWPPAKSTAGFSGEIEKPARGEYFVIAAAGAGVIAALFVLNFGWGGIPFYHARYAFAGLYPIMLVFSGGCRGLIPEDRLAVALPALLLLGYNAAYTFRLVSSVLS